VKHFLGNGAGTIEAEIARFARHIIPVALIELADKARPAKRGLNRLAIVDAGLHGRGQHGIGKVALPIADLIAAGADDQAGKQGRRNCGTSKR
jgi:hypothetical protein